MSGNLIATAIAASPEAKLENRSSKLASALGRPLVSWPRTGFPLSRVDRLRRIAAAFCEFRVSSFEFRMSQ
jgi:hypothetical protein